LWAGPRLRCLGARLCAWDRGVEPLEGHGVEGGGELGEAVPGRRGAGVLLFAPSSGMAGRVSTAF